MPDCWDAGLEGCRKERKQARRNAGKEGYKKGGMQERMGCIAGGMKVRNDALQEGFGTGGIQDKYDAGKQGFRIGARKGAGCSAWEERQERCRKVWMHERRDENKLEFKNGRIQDWRDT